MRVGVVASWPSAARLRSVLLQVQQRVMDRLVLAFERPPPHPLAVLEKMRSSFDISFWFT